MTGPIKKCQFHFGSGYIENYLLCFLFISSILRHSLPSACWTLHSLLFLPSSWSLVWLFWPLILPHNFNIAVSWAGCVPLLFSLYPLLRQPCPFPMTFHTSCTQNLCIYGLDLSSAPEALNPTAVWIFSLGYFKGYRSKPNLSGPSGSAPLSSYRAAVVKCPLPSSSVSINLYVHSYT